MIIEQLHFLRLSLKVSNWISKMIRGISMSELGDVALSYFPHTSTINTEW